MARTLTLSLDGQEIPVKLAKLDREQLYGRVEIEAFDEKGKPSTIKILAADGRTLIDKGGTALAVVSEEGASVSRSQLAARDSNGEPIEPVKSSFESPNVLSAADPDDYLSQMVKAVYVLEGADGASIDYLLDHTAAGGIFKFPFSYRGGLDHDMAFVLGRGSDAFMIVGRPAAYQFVRLNQAATLDPIEDEEISDDDIDFESL